MTQDDMMTIGPLEGMVILRFKEAMEQVAFPPEMALEVADSFAQAAFEADTGLKPVSDSLKAQLIEQHRMKLTQRLSVVLGSQRENKRKTNGALAKELVEIMLREVF